MKKFKNFTDFQIYMENDYVESINDKLNHNHLINNCSKLSSEEELLLSIYSNVLKRDNKKIKVYVNGKSRIIEELGGVVNFKNFADLNTYIEARYSSELKVCKMKIEGNK